MHMICRMYSTNKRLKFECVLRTYYPRINLIHGASSIPFEMIHLYSSWGLQFQVIRCYKLIHRWGSLPYLTTKYLVESGAVHCPC